MGRWVAVVALCSGCLASAQEPDRAAECAAFAITDVVNASTPRYETGPDRKRRLTGADWPAETLSAALPPGWVPLDSNVVVGETPVLVVTACR